MIAFTRFSTGVVILLASASSSQTVPGEVTVERLESPAGNGSAEANLTAGPDGTVYLSWLEPVSAGVTALKFASFDGAKWSAAQTIRAGNDFFVNWADFPAMAVHPSKRGALAAHWLQRHGANSYAYDVRVVTSMDGGKTWGTPTAPHVDRSSTEKGFVVFWPETEGFGAAWLDGRKADKAATLPVQEMQLYATSSAGRAQAAETRLDDRACDCCQTAAAVTTTGPIVAYRDRSSSEVRDIAVVRRVMGKWTAPRLVHDDNWKINACPVNGPSIAANGNRVVLAWYTAADDAPRVKVAFSDDAGATFGAPTQVDEGTPAGRVATVLLADGSALVSWIERDRGEAASVRVRRVTADGKLGVPTTVAASSAGAANRQEARASGFPRIATAGAYVYFAWTVPGRPSMVQVARAKGAAFR